MAGALTPIVRWQILVDGEPVPGAKLFTFASGTSTPLSVYNNADLDPGHAHANPVVADADGVWPVIYLAAAAYRFLVTDSSGTTIYPAQDNVYDLWQIFAATTQTANTVYAGPTTGAAAVPTFRALVAADLPASGAMTLADNGVNDFRLSLTTAVPVTTADVTGASAVTIFAVPYKGNRIAIYDASGVPTYYASSQFSVAVPATTNQMYDIFAIVSGASPSLELLAWTNDTTRATALVANVAEGVYTKSGDATRRYLGSFRTTGVSGQTEDSFAKRYLWNYYNRATRLLRVTEATNSWAYATATYRQANNSAANQIDLVVGVAEVLLNAAVYGAVQDTADNGVALRVAIGEDSATVVATGTMFGPVNVALSTVSVIPVTAYLQKYPAVGRHYYTWLEYGAANATFFGDAGDLSQVNQGIVGVIDG